MSFKETFVEKARLIYKESLDESKARDKAENFIVNYFASLKNDLTEEIEISGGELAIDYFKGEFLKITLDQRELVIDFESIDIVLNLRFIDFQEGEDAEKVLDRLELTNGQFRSRYTSNILTESVLDTYLREAFNEELDRLLENPAF